MSFYKHHIFFCLNHRDGGREHCSAKNAEAMQGYAKGCVKDLGLAGPGGVRVNTSGCLDRCELGPVAVAQLVRRPGDDVIDLARQQINRRQPATTGAGLVHVRPPDATDASRPR